jgi:hypothetical protein
MRVSALFSTKLSALAGRLNPPAALAASSAPNEAAVTFATMNFLPFFSAFELDSNAA